MQETQKNFQTLYLMSVFTAILQDGWLANAVFLSPFK